MRDVVARVTLARDAVGDRERVVLQAGSLEASTFLAGEGVEAVRLRNGRGSVVVLPWFGQMIWSMRFDGVDCAMASGFSGPRRSETIAGTYGCFAFHSGLLRNGVPGPDDDHPAHGEFPCAKLQEAWLELAVEAVGPDGSKRPVLRVGGERDHVVGFGPHYRARPSVRIAEGSAEVSIGMSVENRSGRPMELMYMAHVNWAFVPGGRIVQPAPFTPLHVRVRRPVPAHVVPDAAYLARIGMLGEAPGRTEVLDGSVPFDPEQVFYLSDFGCDPAGWTQTMLRRPEGDAFSVRWRPDELPHCARWLFDDPDHRVAGFALPSTSEAEGHAAERRKGHVAVLAPGASRSFTVETAYLDPGEAARGQDAIAAMRGAGR